MQIMRSSIGNFTFDQNQIVLDSETILSLFKLGIQLKIKNSYQGGTEGIRFGTSESIKISNWIWCLLFESVMKNISKNPIRLGTAIDSGNPDVQLYYSFACLLHKESNLEFSIPLPLLGKRALSSILLYGKSKSAANMRLDRYHGELNDWIISKIIYQISHSALVPEWAIENPYRSFPNFIPDTYPETYPGKTDAWKRGRGEFNEDSPYSKAMDLAQWRAATVEFLADQEDIDSGNEY